MWYYPQTESDEEKLNNFRSVVNKYKMKELDGLIVKKRNATYPRLKCSKLRGAKAGEQLVKNLCDGLIDNADGSIIHDIMDADLGCNIEHNIPFSHKKLSFINLDDKLPDYILHGDDYYIAKLLKHKDEKKIGIIKQIISTANLSLDEINTICHYLMRQGPKFNYPRE